MKKLQETHSFIKYSHWNIVNFVHFSSDTLWLLFLLLQEQQGKLHRLWDSFCPLTQKRKFLQGLNYVLMIHFPVMIIFLWKTNNAYNSVPHLYMKINSCTVNFKIQPISWMLNILNVSCLVLCVKFLILFFSSSNCWVNSSEVNLHCTSEDHYNAFPSLQS